jgi:hypothetical protein
LGRGRIYIIDREGVKNFLLYKGVFIETIERGLI